MITALPRIAIATHDFAGIVHAFRDVLGMPLVDISSFSVPSLGAKLAMAVPPGGSNIELMSPADPAAPLSQSLSRFLARRGDGLFALMLEAPDPNAEAEGLVARGLDALPLMTGASGRDVHPRSTHGVLIRVYPNRSFVPTPNQVVHAASRDLGISGIARVVIAVRDAKLAQETYARRLGLAAGALREDAARGVVLASCRAPEGAEVELAAPLDTSRPFAAALEGQLARSGEGMFALVLRAANPGQVAAQLAARGSALEQLRGERGVYEISPRDLFGARVWLEPNA